MELQLAIERLAGRQKQLLKQPQLVELGLSASGVRKRVAARRLHRIHSGVLAVHPPPYSPHQLYLAATYACAPGTPITDQPAAWLLGMQEELPRTPHVSTRADGRVRLEDVVVHLREIEPRDVIQRFGIPCTSPARTILDCAASASIEELEMLLMAADSGSPGLERGRLERLVNQNAGRRGIRNLRELITDDPKETDSLNERRMLRICRRLGIPEPETQYEIWTEGRKFRADFCWPDLRLIVECDSWRWHGGKLKREDDTERDQLLAIAGWLVVHFTRNQVKLSPELVGPRLAALVMGRR